MIKTNPLLALAGAVPLAEPRAANHGPNAKAVSPAGTPPWLPLDTTLPRSRLVASEIESSRQKLFDFFDSCS